MLNLRLLSSRLAVCRLSPEQEFPFWAQCDEFLAFVHTSDECSVVCDQSMVPNGTQAEKDWRILKVLGPLEFSQIGVLASIAGPLAQASISIFVISTYDTDYILVKDTSLEPAIAVLKQAGHEIEVE